MMYPGLKPGIFVWSPPPCAAIDAVVQLRKARHKRQESMHVFIVPRLMMPLWRKQLYKAADLVLHLPASHSAWPSQMFEPLTIAILYPFLKFRPWQIRGSPQVLDLGRELSRVWREDPGREGPLLWKLRSLQESIATMSPQLAWKLLQSPFKQPVSDCQTRKQ